MRAAGRVSRWVALCGALLCSASCSLHHVREEPPPPVTVPSAWPAPLEGEPLTQPWWRVAGDEALAKLVEEALDDNLTLEQALARVRQSQAIIDQANAALFPSLEAEATAGRQKQFFTLGDRNLIFVTNSFSLALTTGWELDLWKRLASQRSAAALQSEASVADAEATAVSVAAQVAEAWFDLVHRRALLKLQSEQVETNRLLLELVTVRATEGVGSPVEVARQRTQLAQSVAALDPLEAQRETTAHRLLVLLGKAPVDAGRLPDRATLPDLKPLPEIGVPAELLLRRPDLRAWQLRVEAADHQVAAAIAERLPAIRLTADGGFRSDEISSLFTTPVWSFFGNLVAPLLDFGRRAAAVDERRAALDETLAAYGEAFLTAMREVQDALVLERRQRLYLEDLDDVLQSARVALSQSRIRYVEGVAPYLDVLTALQTVQSLEREELEARRRLVSYRVNLYRALGGGWTAHPDQPTEER